MSDGNICSDDEKYGGFGAAMAKLLHCRDSAAPAHFAVAAVAAARTPGTKKSPSVNVTKCTRLTKHPYKRQNKHKVPVLAPQAAAPAAVPAPVPLVTSDNDVVCAPVEKKSPPSFLPCPLWRQGPFRLASPSIRAVLSSRS